MLNDMTSRQGVTALLMRPSWCHVIGAACFVFVMHACVSLDFTVSVFQQIPPGVTDESPGLRDLLA
jgi:hypothetical protein